MRVFINHPTRSLLLEEIAEESQIPEDQIENLLEELRSDGIYFDGQNIFGVIYQPQEYRLNPDVISARMSTQWWGKTYHYW